MRGFSKLSCGFLFTMIDFRINGIDILPDIIGYILFLIGLTIISEKCGYFQRARNCSIPLIILSIFSIYQTPASSVSINFISFDIIAFIIGITTVILDMVMIYNICLGVENIALLSDKEKVSLANEAEKRWRQYLLLVILSFLSIILVIIPALFFVCVVGLLVFNITLAILMINFMNKCENEL